MREYLANACLLFRSSPASAIFATKNYHNNSSRALRPQCQYYHRGWAEYKMGCCRRSERSRHKCKLKGCVCWCSILKHDFLLHWAETTLNSCCNVVVEDRNIAAFIAQRSTTPRRCWAFDPSSAAAHKRPATSEAPTRVNKTHTGCPTPATHTHTGLASAGYAMPHASADPGATSVFNRQT